jgi:pimeloyl-ACP methyl ester carboxylesterase
MAHPTLPNIPVIDFRRQSMVLQWHSLGGTWTACDVPPDLVHGVALIRASQPNFCLFAHDGRLNLQIGPAQFALSEDSPRIRWSRGLTTLRLHRRLTVESSSGGVLFSNSCWNGQGDEFFSWLASRAADPEWRAANGKRWSEGVEPAVLRSS